jgi:two-component system, NarL family, nitrate/nitrite response regulator NarL
MERWRDATSPNEPAAASIRILLVMDEVVVRTGLRMLLESWPEMRIVGESRRTAEALAIASREKPDLALCDSGGASSEPDPDFLFQLVRAMGTKSVILLSGDDDPISRLRAISTGINGIVYKGKALGELRSAILKVHAGELWLDRVSAAKFIMQITRPAFANISDPVRTKFASLTERERQIAYLICQGLQNEEIGKRLSISDTTVRHHLTSIFARIGVSNRLELSVFLYRHHFAGFSVDQEFAFSR